MKYVDLHTHTCLSDGYYTPSDLILEAKKAGLSAIALTDHDCVKGIDEAFKKAQEEGIELIKGIEISCFDKKNNKTVHMLGLFIKELSNLDDIIKKVHDMRLHASLSDMKQYNQKFGLNITEEDIKKCVFLHKVIVDKGYASDYPARSHMKAQVNHTRFGADVYEAIDAIHKAKGIAVIAHPCLLNMTDEELFSFIADLKEHGLDGIECFHTRHTKKQSNVYLKIAEELDLIISGGSDFHGKYKPNEAFGKGKDTEYLISYDYLEKMKLKIFENLA